MARLLYRLLLLLLIPALVIRLLWRARKQPEYLRHLGERFGRYPARPQRPVLWLHAVSVGEARAAEPLIKALAARHPNHALLITCMTPTGRATAESLYGSFASIAYLPYDFAFAQRRFLRHWTPRLGVLMETELWPNLLFEAKRAGVPTALINARLSARSARGYARFGALARPVLSTLCAVAAQTGEDAARLAAVGAPAPVVCGNLKFEVTPAESLLVLGRDWQQRIVGDSGRFIWLAASTRDGEETLILDALSRLAEKHPSALLVLVPRHPQRFDEVATLVSARGFRLQRRSLGLANGDTQVWLGDSMGEMAAYFALANCCVMGGSLGPYGSQNLIEACACGCPVLIGPSDFNFRQAAADAIALGAAQRVAATPQAIADTLAELIEKPARLAGHRQAAAAFAGEHRGATERTQAVLDGLFKNES